MVTHAHLALVGSGAQGRLGPETAASALVYARVLADKIARPIWQCQPAESQKMSISIIACVEERLRRKGVRRWSGCHGDKTLEAAFRASDENQPEKTQDGMEGAYETEELVGRTGKEVADGQDTGRQTGWPAQARPAGHSKRFWFMALFKKLVELPCTWTIRMSFGMRMWGSSRDKMELVDTDKDVGG